LNCKFRTLEVAVALVSSFFFVNIWK
jgi:hypothetical protein